MAEKLDWPHNEDSEKVLLGTALVYGQEIMPLLRATLTAQDFYFPRHQALFQACLDLYEQHRMCDASMLRDYLRERSMNDEQIGGGAYIGQLLTCVLTPESIGPHTTRIREASGRRQAMIAARETLRRAADTRYELVDVVRYGADKLNESLPKISRGARPLYEIAAVERERIRKELSAGVSVGFKSGWAKLNRILSPVSPGQLIVIGARPRMGKTAFMVNWALSLAEQNLPGVLYSLEMSDEELSLRALLRYTQTTNNELQHPSELVDNAAAVLADIDTALERLPNGILINDDASLTLGDMREELGRLQKVKPFSWVMVDFLQLARADKNYRSRAEEVGAMAYELASMAKDFNCAIIALSQLSRSVEAETPHRPRMDHFLESGKIEAAAHRMLYIYRPSEYGDSECKAAGYPVDIPELTEIGILKQRSGKSTGKTVLYYDGDHYKFRDLFEPERRAMRGEE